MKKPKKKEAAPLTETEVQELCSETLASCVDRYFAARDAGDAAKAAEINAECLLWREWRRQSYARQHPGSVTAIILAARRASSDRASQ
jgi:hypothetical protein